jgi:hypothetical protein
MTEHSSYLWRSRRNSRPGTRRSLFWPIAAISAATRFYEGTGVAPIVPKVLTSSGTKRGFFARQDFIYDAEHRPLHLSGGSKTHQDPSPRRSHRRLRPLPPPERLLHMSAQTRCTPTQRRIIKRWENEDVLDRMQARLDRMPEAMGVRRQTVEHPFGTLKAWMGATHFLTRTLDKVRTEMSRWPTTSSE